MRSKIFFLTVLFASFLCIVFGQSTGTYIGNADKSEIALKGKIDNKGNNIVVGYSSNMEPDVAVYDYKYTDMLIAKLNDKGDLLWSKILGVDNELEDMFHSFDFTDKGDIIAVGTSERVPANFPYTSVYSKACIYKFDGTTGSIIWSRHVSIDNFNSVPNRRGDIYLDVKVLPNGNIVASGEKDFSPNYSDGIITLFDPNGNILASKVYEIPSNTSGLWHVDYDDSHIYVTGNHQGASYMDMSVAKLDYSLNTIWIRNYDFSYLANNSQHMKDIISHTDTSIIVTTLIDLGWGGTGDSYTAVTAIRKSNGGVIANFAVLNSGFSVQGLPSLYISPSNTHYLINNPTSTFYNFYFPNYGIPGAGSLDYILNVNYDNPITNIINGSQIINHVHGDKGNLMMSGTSKNDPDQIGMYDIFIHKLSHVQQGFISKCITRIGKVSRYALSTTVTTPATSFADVGYSFIPVDEKIEGELKAVSVCETRRVNSPAHSMKAKEAYNIEIYPNPVENNLNINLDGWENNLVISIFDIHGKKVYENQHINNNGNTISIPINDFISGNYIIELNDHKGTFISKIFTKY